MINVPLLLSHLKPWVKLFLWIIGFACIFSWLFIERSEERMFQSTFTTEEYADKTIKLYWLLWSNPSKIFMKPSEIPIMLLI